MAPGCFSPSANKDIQSQQPQQQQQQHQQQAMETSLPDFANKSSILEICIDTPVDYTFHFVSSPNLTTTTTTADDLNLNSCSKQTETIKGNCLENSYAGEINLDQIPLPSTPPPSRYEDEEEEESDDEEDDSSSSDESSSEEEEDEESSEEEDEEREEEVKKEGNLLELKKKPALLTNSGRVDHHVNLIFDTADTFEILEQTIMKQKRLAKLKNTDLRRKVLLKRTFDLVLEIMDAENGFNDDEPDSPMLSQATTTTEEEELVLNSTQQQQQQQQQPLELELHPDDGKPKTQLIPTTPILLSNSNHNSTTLNVVCVSSVKLVDYDLDEDQEEQEASTTPTPTTTTTIQIDQARVPRQLKRRSSASDDDEEEDEDDEDPEEEYEYSTIYTNDQELNYRSTHLAACVSAHDLNIYNDNVQIELEKSRTTSTTSQTEMSDSTTASTNSKSAADSRRSDHPRKKLRAA